MIKTSMGLNKYEKDDLFNILGENGLNETIQQINDFMEDSAQSKGNTVERAESVDWLRENGDTNKIYILPDGAIYLWQLTEIDGYTNRLTQAVNADGTAYIGNNGEIGYKTGYRLNSSHQEVQAENRCCTGYIPIKPDDVLRLYNISHNADPNYNGYIQFFKSDFTYLGCMYETAGFFDVDIVPKDVINLTKKANYIAYFRLSTGEIDNTSIITINEEIQENGIVIGYDWEKLGKETELALQLQNENLETLKTETADNKKKIETLETEVAELKKANEPVPLYTNLLSTATDTDRTTIYEGKGYKTETRLSSSSSGSPTDAIGKAVCASGFISAKEGDILRIKGISFVTGISLYVIAYDSNNAVVKYNTLSGDAELGFIDKNYQKYADGILEITLSSEYFSTGFDAIRFSGGDINESTIVTINEEIKENNPVDMTILQEQINANAEAIKTNETNILLLNDRMNKLEEVESNVPLSTNLLPTAEMGADQSTGWVEGKGYTQNARLSGSSGAVTTNYTTVAGECVSGYIPVNPGDIVRIKGFYAPQGVNSYVVVYNDTASVKNQTFATVDGAGNWREGTWYTLDTTELNKGTATFTLDSTNFGTDFNALRFSGVITENTIITVNEEIKENNSGGSSTEEGEVDKLKLIREWDAPIYDANIPVFELTTEKTAVSSAERTPTAIYAKYDALMAKHPKYITKTNLGLCSDGVTPVYRYDFREPEPYHQSNMPWSETKTKAILASGIHFEWAGIYSLYYALEEIAENPKLSNLRRNTHFIVIPVINPYCTLVSNYDASIGVLNANGVQIHRNFEVGFIYPGESGYVEAGNRNHGGIEPLSEVETQYVDNVLKENTDAAFFLTCHNYDAPSETNGISFIWPSTATKYMCNMGFRLIDKMSIAWLDKYSDELVAGIADYRTENVSDDFLRFGHAHVSKTDGTETRQATKYGIQGANVEVCHTFWVHGTKANPEPSMSAFTMSRGAETYINFLLTACGCYDYKDKALYT